VARTGETREVDGIRMEFQITPGTEAPAEMNLYFPDHAALCMAENATHTLHNILTLRGAVVRDPNIWALYLTEAIDLYVDRSDVVFASHHWPTWGRERVRTYLGEQRDIYAYLHDQTLRMMNKGLTGPEIAEAIELPAALDRAWNTRGYYGSISHNVKAVYQRYMGWYDGNPANLWKHPPVEAGRRYVRAMGGADAVLAVARDAFDAGDYRWVTEILNHVIFAGEATDAVTSLQADAFEQLGFGSENGTWRSAYLAGAYELRRGNFGTPAATATADLMAALTPSQVFDAIAIRVDGPRAADEHLTLGIVLEDGGTATSYRLELNHGVLVHHRAPAEGADLVIRMASAGLPGLLAGNLDGAQLDGDPAVLGRLTAVLESPDPDFGIVTP
jgi:alkyl sulfatase BDS1-like metallo-beta-lactamase superfamily hydrolase